MSRASEPIASGAPKLGEHNREIYCDVLGMSQDRLQALIEQRVVY